MNIKNKIFKLVNKYKPKMIKFCQDVIRIPSFSTQEGKLINRIAHEMRASGFDKVIIDKMGNVIGQIGSGKTKILIDAHIDTVGVGDEDAWKFPPFSGLIKNGKIWGRGATDQKAAIAPMVYAGKIIKELNLTNNYTLWIVGSVQEEDCDGLPLVHIIEKEKLKPDFVILTEQTNLNVHCGQRGRMEIKIVTKGKSAHASAPQRGENAIVKMSDIINDVTSLNQNLKVDEFLGKGSVAVTKIECKTPSVNAIPDECTIYIDRRLTRGETKSLALQQLKNLSSVKKSKAKVIVDCYKAKSWKGLVVQQEKYFPGWVLPQEHKLVKLGVKTAQIVLQKKPKVDKWIFSTNGVATAGRFGIPTIGFGPSQEIYAHTVKENVKISDLVFACAFYCLFPKILVDELQ